MQQVSSMGRIGSRRQNVADRERKASILGGAAMAATGIASLAKRRYIAGALLGVGGSFLLYRGATGHCDLYQAIGVDTARAGITIDKSITVNRPPREVYEYWHNLRNLSSFMEHIESVDVTGHGRSHWVARGPGNMRVEWDAEVLEDRPDKISWRSKEGSDVANEGMVEFHEAPAGRGTEVKVHLMYQPPGGAIGKAAASVANLVTSQQLEEDLKRFKQVLETGEVSTAASGI